MFFLSQKKLRFVSLLLELKIKYRPILMEMTYLNVNVRIHFIIIQSYSILAISMKHLGLPKCVVSKLTCFRKNDSGLRQNDKRKFMRTTC